MGGRRRRQVGAALLGLALLTCSCTGAGPRGAASSAATTAAAAGAGATGPGGPGWSGWRSCAGTELASLLCGSLVVPLDHDHPADPAGQAGRTLTLEVAEGGDRSADRTLLFLTGGPGQPGVPFAPRIIASLGEIAQHHRVVLVDQRGTGANALVCPLLQEQVGYADLEVPTDQAVTECGSAIGADAAHYGTTDTVADLEQLRAAIGVDRWSIDGVSYGTYVAQRYAAAHQAHVDRLVLDSVVPVDAFSGTNVESFPDVAAVLRDVCAAEHCAGDPAQDLSTVVARYRLGPALLDVVSLMSVVDPDFTGLLAALHAAAAGEPEALRTLVHHWQDASAGPADQLSQGLHASTLCLDLDFPWGGADAAPASRAQAADRAVARLSSSQLFPFDAQTARGNGELRTCELWPKVADPQPASLELRGVRALLLHGSRDLSTPLAWAHRAQADLPGSRLVVVPGAGHGVQTRGPASARAVVADFLG
ncbi:alpha/beta fold hydrolase [Angustibacter luteus]|uniref:alpha/beta fold hydrolase n=1 Tax=Angustibacter luteus TaxID=658456 RepID=UPI00366CA667